MKTFSATVFLTMFSFIPLQAKAIQIELSERTLVPGEVVGNKKQNQEQRWGRTIMKAIVWWESTGPQERGRLGLEGDGRSRGGNSKED